MGTSELNVGALGLGTRGALGLGTSTGFSSDFFLVAVVALALVVRLVVAVVDAFVAGFLAVVVVALAFLAVVAVAVLAAVVRAPRAFATGFSTAAVVAARRGRLAVTGSFSSDARFREGRVDV